jgi:hypothetical protein
VKRFPFFLVMLLLGAMAAASHASDKSPALNIEAALKIAQDYLKSAAPSEPRFISSLSLENPTVTGRSYWYARWSSPIINGAKGQVGLRIDMDGSLTKIVSEGGGTGGGGRTTWGASGPSVPVPGVGSQKYGVRNMH